MNLGILGGGQLARMLAMAAHPLNIKCLFLDPAADACAAPMGNLLQAAYDDPASLEHLSNECDRITFEFENVPARALEILEQSVAVAPAAVALRSANDRVVEKNLFHQLGIETAPFAQIDSEQDLLQAAEKIGVPGILKSRHSGYDGKGQAVIRDIQGVEQAWKSIGEVSAIYEGFVPFESEASIIAVRSSKGEIRFYPLVENTHNNGILTLSIPSEDHPLQALAESMVSKLSNELNYVGVIALELFKVGDKLLANEYSPRVHNSGHWTIEGALTSQFENHVRAVCDLPLGDTSAFGPSAMINIVGKLPDIDAILKVPGAHLHLYDKRARTGRKIGHITICCKDRVELKQRIEQVSNLINID